MEEADIAVLIEDALSGKSDARSRLCRIAAQAARDTIFRIVNTILTAMTYPRMCASKYYSIFRISRIPTGVFESPEIRVKLTKTDARFMTSEGNVETI